MIMMLSVDDAAQASHSAAYADGTRRYWRAVEVDANGTVRAWDEVSETYSTLHGLTQEQEQRARELAREGR